MGSDGTARLGLIPGQVQFDAAQSEGIPFEQIVAFADQPDAVAALLDGRIDAFAATAVGNRAIVANTPEWRNTASREKRSTARSGRTLVSCLSFGAEYRPTYLGVVGGLATRFA